MSLVLGLTGPNAAGKGEVAACLERRGFTLHSLSDIVREEARALGLTTGRADMIEVGNRLRRSGGAGVLAERMLSRIGRRDVVDSIRNPVEVEVLRRLSGFQLLGVRAPVQTRFERALARARPGDPRTLDEFRQREEQENTTDPAAQRLDATLALADRFLDNDGDRAALERKVVQLLADCPAGTG